MSLQVTEVFHGRYQKGRGFNAVVWLKQDDGLERSWTVDLDGYVFGGSILYREAETMDDYMYSQTPEGWVAYLPAEGEASVTDANIIEHLERAKRAAAEWRNAEQQTDKAS